MAVSQLEVVGKRLSSVDSKVKSTGQALFMSDMRLPGMLRGRVLRSPHPHARILNVDTTRARRLAGVKAVITAADTVKAQVGPAIADEPMLAFDRVRYIGDEVAAVAAVDIETAEEALRLIDVEYEPLPAVYDPTEAMLPDAPLIHDGAKGNIALRRDLSRGDVDRALAEADYIFEDRYETQSVHQSYLEPNGCVAWYTDDSKLVLWAPLQNPFTTRAMIAKALGLAESKIRIVQPFIGGGFGGAKTSFKIHAICGLLSQTAGRPVCLVNNRTEEFAVGRPRVPMTIELTLGARRDGTLVAKQTRIVADNGAYTLMATSVLTTAAMRADNLYRIPNLKTEALLVYTNKTPTSAFRGFGNPQMHFALESSIEAIADELGIDPGEMRLKNVVGPGEVTAHGWQIGSCGIRQCVHDAVASSSWRTRLASGKSKRRGIGMACCIHVAGNRLASPLYDGSSALIKIDEKNTVTLWSGEVDLGQGSKTILAQIAAEVLGLPLDAIETPRVDTDVSPYALGTNASRVTTLAGNAVRAAAIDAKRQILETAAEMLECVPEDVQIKDSRVFVQGAPDRSLAFSEVATARVFRQGGAPVLGQGHFVADSTVYPDRQTLYGNISTAYTFGAQIAEVEIDLDTGDIQLVDFVAAHDLGKAINPMLAEGQIEGGIAQAIGYALTEELVWDNGVMRNPNFHDYQLPSPLDLPPIKIALVEPGEARGPFGAKSVSEAATVPGAAAIANAVYNATGIRIRDLPITKEKLWQAMRERGLVEQGPGEVKKKVPADELGSAVRTGG